MARTRFNADTSDTSQIGNRRAPRRVLFAGRAPVAQSEFCDSA